MKQGLSRNAKLDILKGVSIILVIFAHCIQFGSGSDYLESKLFFNNVVFKFIYSFHMPLFMLISGYLFYFSIQKHPLGYNLKTKLKTLLIPIIIWQTIWLFLTEFHVLTELCASYFFYTYLNTLWFITSVFINSYIVLICNKFVNDSICFYCLIIIISLFIPNIHGYNLYVFMFPYFLCAYLYNKTGGLLKTDNKSVKTIGFICLSCFFAILLSRYEISDYAYTSGTCIIRNRMFSIAQFYTDIFRWSIGLIGSLCVILFFDIIFSKGQQLRIIKGLCVIGTKTMGLYIISTYLFKCFYLLPIKEFSYINILIETILTISISYFIIWLLEKNKYTRTYLFGGR